ncbi:aminopeptidase N [Coxiella endosymbiont of Amblyomma americanum]|uniref:aminopeptidase N n=1 Tax=Coxiella endosymbiont of Amblyomma americanum TaxID=325775 RepID=UPI00057CF4F8|nr:aminopeptidase N [Coxiella endosymbiont of Amblyomma americanum]AJC50476.1 aminopeptidase N [Coxiella endosymbiont of Amblyomma americanum]
MKAIYLEDYRPPEFLADAVNIHVDLYEEETSVKTILNLRRNSEVNTLAPLTLNGEEISLKRIALNGQALSSTQYQLTDSLLTISNVPEVFVLESEVTIKPQKNFKLSGLYKSKNNFCSQCEPHGFRRITYFLDRPDVLAIYTTTITADKDRYPFLLSNGNLIEKRIINNNRQWVHWKDPFKKPSYLFALVAGDFDVLEDVFVTRSGRVITLRLFLERGFKNQGGFALQALKQAMAWDEKRFGREYDLDIYMIVAVSDFNVGAMENKGINIFNIKNILASLKTTTDEDYIRIENVVGHEYFHNWSGNRITCRDWFQITLKEGLTVFRDQSFTEDMTSKDVARIKSVDYLRNVQFLEDASPTAHAIRPHAYVEVNNFYTSTVYNKGAEVIRMMKTLLGSELFYKAMNLYFCRYDGKAITIEDFIHAMEEASGKNFNQFTRWYDHVGTQVLDIKSEYDEDKEILTVEVRQYTLSAPKLSSETLHIPLAFGLLDPEEQQDMPTQLAGIESNVIRGTRILEIKKCKEVFKFLHVKKKPILSFLRDFSAPVRLNYPYSDEELLWLFQFDNNSFSRWEAGQIFVRRLILNLVEDYRQKKSLKLDNRFMDSFRKIIQESHKDYGYAAMLMLLPSETYLMQFMKHINIEDIYNVRQFIRRKLAITLIAELTEIYKSCRSPCASYSWISAGKRALRDCCLDYLTENEREKQYVLAYQQFKDSNNMTDTMGALSALINHECEERYLALDAFYQRWKGQPLVINKWMALQASSRLSSTIENVKGLMQCSVFNVKNPNSVYALLVTFGTNIVSFHNKSGAGYRLIADCVLKIDLINPQVAVRVLQPLLHWEMMDKNRQELMKAELNRIVKTAKKLSPNAYEIIMKSLGNADSYF